jgi:CxxC-x17-CxxC domain-containing protein
MSDQHITCSECGSSFVFTEAERKFYDTKGLAGPPKRCKACRQARKAADGARGGGGRPGARDGASPWVPRGRGPETRGGGGRPEARDGASPWAPRGRGPETRGGGGGDRPRDRSPAARPAAAGGWGRTGGGDAPRPRRFVDGAPADAGGRGPNRRAPGRGTAPSAHAGADERPRRPQGAQPEAARPERARREVHEVERGRFRPRRSSSSQAISPADTAEVAPTRASKRRTEHPKFDVTCVQCGAATKVPFKPIEGRDVFCQPCYRARHGVAAAAVTRDEPDETGD